MSTYTEKEPVGSLDTVLNELAEDAEAHFTTLDDMIQEMKHLIHPKKLEKLEEIAKFLDFMTGTGSTVEKLRECDDELRQWGAFWVEKAKRDDF
jgi:4-diphosphocytidyl-2C-methyl-D-erythritol kinase